MRQNLNKLQELDKFILSQSNPMTELSYDESISTSGGASAPSIRTGLIGLAVATIGGPVLNLAFWTGYYVESVKY